MDEKQLDEIINHYKPARQIIKLIEELSELSGAVARYINRPNAGHLHLCVEEIADVEIMIKQFKMITHTEDEIIDKIKIEKINRTLKRMEE